MVGRRRSVYELARSANHRAAQRLAYRDDSPLWLGFLRASYLPVVRFAKVVLSTLVTIGGAILLALSTWLLFRAQVWTGRAIAVLGFATIVLPIAAYIARKQGRHRGLWTAVGLFTTVVWVALLFVILLSTPTGKVSPDSPVRHRFTTPTEFPRYNLANIVPEIEQVNLGFLVIPYMDPILTPKQASRVSDFTLELYREMERDPNFHQLGSVMAFAYADLLGQPPDAGHYYLYVPKKRGEGPLPVLLFLHGSGGNFKTYLWVWSRLAEQQGLIIIAPSFGFGNWLEPGATRSVLRALDDASTFIDIDEERVFLAGLSNGGLGVSQLAAAAPERFRGLIFLSPVMATGLLENQAFVENWKGRPVLVVTGEADERVPYEYVQRHVRQLKGAGARITMIAYPGEDHFLFFSRPDDILNDISKWFLENE